MLARPERRSGQTWVPAAQALLGAAALGAVGFAAFRLQASTEAAALLFLFVVVPVAIGARPVASVLVSILAILALGYFFTSPGFSFDLRPADPLDVVTVVAFAAAALIISPVMSAVRKSFRENSALRDELRTIVDTIPTMVWRSRPDGAGDFVNRIWLEYAGLTAQQAQGSGWQAAVHPEDRARVADAWHRATASGEPFEQERRLRQADGAYRWVLSRAVALRDREGTVQSWYGTNTDIEDRKRAEEALRRSEERFALAIAGANEGLFDWDLATDRVFLSPRAQELSGLAPGEPSRPREEWATMVRSVPEDADRQRQAVRAHLAGDTPAYDVESRVILPGGEVRWLRQRGAALRDPSGKAYRMAGSIEDITDRKTVEDELRLRKEELQRLMESVSDYLWSAEVAADGSYGYRYYSPVVARITGCTAEYLSESRERWVSLLHPLDRAWVDEIFRQLISGAIERVNVEYRILRPDGTLRWVRDSAHGTRVEGGRILLYGVVGDITERKLAEQALRESEARFRNLTEFSSDWYWRQDESLGFVYASNQAYEVTGDTPDSSFGKKRWELTNITPLSCSWAEHQAVLSARQPFRDFEYSRLAPDGATRYVSVSGVPIFDDEGRFKGYQGVARNITERMEAEKSLKHSERRFRQLFENSIDALFIHDERGRFVDCNAAACKALGYAREELLRLSVADIAARLLSKEQRRQMKGGTLWQRAMSGEPGRIVGFEENELRRKDGTTFPVEVGVGAIEYDGRRLIYASVRDTTDRKRAAAAVRTRQEMLDLAQKAARATAFEWRLGAGEGENRWSADLEAMYGLAPGSYDGTYEAWKRLVFPEDWPAVEAAIERAGESGDVAAEYRVVHPDGAVRWLQAKGRVFFDAEGRPARIVGFMLDVTERHASEEELRRLERQLRQAQRLEAMGTLAERIAHDFNNILGAILGYGEMALRDAAKGSRLRRDLDSIMTAGERGRALVDRVLAFSRSGLGERVAVHVEKVAREALDLLEAKLPAGIHVEAKLRAGRAAMLG